MLVKSSERVRMHTAPAVTSAIRRRMLERIAYLSQNPALIDKRLEELDREWDLERVLETGAASLTLTGLVLGVTRRRRWLLLSLAVQAFFLQHAMQGWCPPLPLLRRIGVRTQEEIDEERYALRALRGDFDDAKYGAEEAEAAAIRIIHGLRLGSMA